MEQIALHHTSVSRSRQKYQLRAVNRYHKQKWDMKSALGWYVGYNYFIDVDGTTTYTRKIGEETMAQRGHNFDTISICLAGNFSEEYPLSKQNSSLRALMKEIKETYPSIKTTTHRALGDTNCPGTLFTDEYMKSILREPTPQEKEKQEKIEEMQSTIDILINFISNKLKGY